MTITQEINIATELIRHPERMDRSTVAALKAAIEHYPFYQALYLLLLQNMYKVHDPEFSAYLKKYAVFVADRSALFDMIEGANYQIPVQKLADNDDSADTGDRTLTLIDNFLSTLPDTPASASSSAKPLTFPNDYSAYLEQLPDCSEAENAPVEIGITPTKTENAPTKTENVPAKAENAPAKTENAPAKPENAPVEVEITHAETGNTPTEAKNTPAETAKVPEQLQQPESKPNSALHPKAEPAIAAPEDEFTVTAIRKHLAEQTDEELASSSAEISNNDNSGENGPDSDYFTEAMAGIYIKQQKYEQAFEIIKAISMDNPKKSVYFADQMRYLQLLIRINRNKK